MEKEVSIAIIDDDAALASNLKDILEAEGYRVQAVNDGRAGMALFQEKIFDLALVDIKLPEIPGPELVRRLSRLRPETEYIMITAYATMETAVEVIRQKQVIGYENKPVDMDHLLTFIREVMRRRRAEESQRISDANYHTIFDTANDAIFVHDFANGRIIDVNRKMCDMYGYTVEEARHIDVEVLSEGVPPYSQEEAMGWIQKAAEGSPQIFEWKARDKDGELFWVEVNLKRTTMGNEDRLLAIVRDINERKQTEKEKAKLEAQLQQTQKMEVIATLAGGVAHEFNNALMGIMGNIELLKMELPEDERRAKYFKAMNESGHRMSRLTDQLLAYAQGGKYQARDLKLDDFIIETLPILQHDLSPEVRVETHFAKMSYIRADYAQMQMVLSAILANSNEAIEDEGLIRIAAENKDIDEDSLKQHPGLKPGPYVCLTIEDDGKGMDEETKDGIFEPFFTTKFQGRGMGMAAVYGIIKNHDGAIIVDSEPGKGTVVRIYLPAISVESKQEAKAVKQPETEIAMGEGTILIIEDEETLVDLFREILERLGYRVLLARTGKEAVELAKTFDGQIDLALLDIKLPDMDGGRVYPLIMEARPDLKVIVCSGIRPFAEKLKEVLDAG